MPKSSQITTTLYHINEQNAVQVFIKDENIKVKYEQRY